MTGFLAFLFFHNHTHHNHFTSITIIFTIMDADTQSSRKDADNYKRKKDKYKTKDAIPTYPEPEGEPSY